MGYAPRLAIVLLLGPFAAIVSAQDDQPAAKTTLPRGPIGDPSRFTRLGGWGGIGGMAGQFGMSRTTLIMTPAVQEELKLTEAQKKRLKEWESASRKRGEQAFNPPARPPAEPGVDGLLPLDPNANGPNGFNPFAIADSIKAMVSEGEEGLAKILNKAQRNRLDQLSLQMEGLSALARPEVAEAVNLSPEQSEQIEGVLNESRTAQMSVFVGQTMDIARTRRGNNGEATTKPADPSKDEPEAAAKRRVTNRERDQIQVAKFMDGGDKIQNETVVKIIKILTRRQRERFEKLLGAPFDPAKLNGPDGLPRPGLPPTETIASPTPKAKAEMPAPAKSSRLRNSRYGGEAKSKDQ